VGNNKAFHLIAICVDTVQNSQYKNSGLSCSRLSLANQLLSLQSIGEGFSLDYF